MKISLVLNDSARHTCSSLSLALIVRWTQVLKMTTPVQSAACERPRAEGGRGVRGRLCLLSSGACTCLGSVQAHPEPRVAKGGDCKALTLADRALRQAQVLNLLPPLSAYFP